MTRAGTIRTLCLAALAVALAAAAAADTLDAFHDALPANDCLPNTGLPIVFLGEYCDGVYCPPDPVSSCALNTAEQSGLPDVLAGATRTVTVLSADGASAIVGQVRTGLGLLGVTSDAGVAHELDLQYGGGTVHEMNLNLVAGGATDIEFSLAGDLSAANPLYVGVVLATMETTPGGFTPHTTSTTLTVDHAGTVALPLSAFPPVSGFSAADLDLVLIRVSDCPLGGGCAPPARSWLVGAISFPSTGSVPTAHTSWAWLKAHYR